MYQVYADGYLLYDPQGANTHDKYILLDPTLNLGVGIAGSFDFGIQYDHPNIDKIKRMASVIDVKQDGNTIFRGRVIRDSVGFRGTHSITVEGLGTVLNDSIQEPFNFPMDYVNTPEYQQAAATGNVVEYFLNLLIERHNRQVGNKHRINLGSVTVRDPNNYISRSAEDPANTWETLEEKLTGSSLGGYLVFRYEGNEVYLDYINRFEVVNNQEITFARNLMDFTDEVFGGDMYNAIYPVGKEGLTIASCLDGTYSGFVKDGTFLYDPAKVEEYGRITKIINWDDVTVPENLLSRAVTNLQDLSGAMPKTISVSAFDLSVTEQEVPFAIAKNVKVVSAPHGYSDYYPVMNISIDLVNPANTMLTLSKASETYTATMQKAQNDINVVIQDIKGTATETKEDLEQRLVKAESSVTQSADDITALVTRLDSLNQQLTELKATAEGLIIQVTNIERGGVDSVTTSSGYTFGADGLVISKQGEEMENKLDNTGLYVSRSGVPILTANNDGVEAINLHAQNYLIIGTNDRFEDYSTAADPHRTGAFYVGPDW